MTEFRLIYFVLNVADLWLTAIGLQYTGGVGEANPGASAAYAAFGVPGLVIYKAVVYLLIIAIIGRLWHRRAARVLAVLGTALLAGVVLYNLWVLSPILW